MSSVADQWQPVNTNPVQAQAASPAATGSPEAASWEITAMLAHCLAIPSILQKASEWINDEHFDRDAEAPYEVIWNALCHVAAECGGEVLLQAVRHALYARLNDAREGARVVRAIGEALGENGFLDQIARQQAGELAEGYGVSLVRQFLLARDVSPALQNIVEGREELGDTLRWAADRADEIERAWGPARQEQLQFISSREFAQANYDLRWHVPDLLVRGQPVIVGGPSKSLKTSIMLDLATAIASRQEDRFLNHFSVERGRVLFVSAESGEATIRETVRRILQGRMNVDLANLNMTWCFQAPRLANSGDMRLIRRRLEADDIDIVFFDPLYLLLLAGGGGDVSAANLYQVGPLLREICQICLDAGATPVLIHHFNRAGSMHNEPPTLENLAFAGVTEFARQWLLINRQQRYEPGSGSHRLWLVAGGSVGVSRLLAVDVEEGQLCQDFGGRRWQVLVESASEARERGRNLQRQRQEEERDEEAVTRGCEILQYLRSHLSGDTSSNIRAAVGISQAVCMRAISRLLEGGQIERTQVRRTNGQNYGGYRIPREEGVECGEEGGGG